jgi:hypothetical protein
MRLQLGYLGEQALFWDRRHRLTPVYQEEVTLFFCGCERLIA